MNFLHFAFIFFAFFFQNETCVGICIGRCCRMSSPLLITLSRSFTTFDSISNPLHPSSIVMIHFALSSLVGNSLHASIIALLSFLCLVVILCSTILSFLTLSLCHTSQCQWCSLMRDSSIIAMFCWSGVRRGDVVGKGLLSCFICYAVYMLRCCSLINIILSVVTVNGWIMSACLCAIF